MALLAKMILEFRPNFYIPLQKVEKIMRVASQVDAAVKGKFWFRVGDWDREPRPVQTESGAKTIRSITADAIVNGPETTTDSSGFPGLIPMIRSWMSGTAGLGPQLQTQLNGYLEVVSRRAAGTLPTDARWIRNFVSQHPSYRQGSAVPDDIVFDLIQQCLSRAVEI